VQSKIPEVAQTGSYLLLGILASKCYSKAVMSAYEAYIVGIGICNDNFLT
jgi:hypothetical protein